MKRRLDYAAKSRHFTKNRLAMIKEAKWGAREDHATIKE